MAATRRYLKLRIREERIVEASVFEGDTCIVTEKIAPPALLSEDLWKLLPRWFSKDTTEKLAGVAFERSGTGGTYSAQRTLLSIINTLGIVEKIPIVEVTEGAEWKKIRQKLDKTSQKNISAIKAIY